MNTRNPNPNPNPDVRRAGPSGTPRPGGPPIPSTFWIAPPSSDPRRLVETALRTPGTPVAHRGPDAAPTHDEHATTTGTGAGTGGTGDVGRGRAATPFWAGMVTDPTDPTDPTGHESPRTADPNEHTGAEPSRTDDGGMGLLVVEQGTRPARDELGLRAHALLGPGGLLAVLTHLDRTGDGALVDPTGSVVASAQNADLLYLQHIVITTPAVETTAPTTTGTTVGCDYLDLSLFLRPHHAHEHLDEHTADPAEGQVEVRAALHDGQNRPDGDVVRRDAA